MELQFLGLQKGLSTFKFHFSEINFGQSIYSKLISECEQYQIQMWYWFFFYFSNLKWN